MAEGVEDAPGKGASKESERKMMARSRKRSELYLSLPVLKDMVTELRQEVDALEKWGTYVVERSPDTVENQLADWLGEMDGSLMHMGIITKLLQEQLDLLWDTVPDDDGDGDGEEEEEEPTPIFWSLAQAAGKFGLSASTLRNQAVKGQLKAVQIGRNWSTTREWMEEYLASRTKNAKPVRIP